MWFVDNLPQYGTRTHIQWHTHIYNGTHAHYTMTHAPTTFLPFVSSLVIFSFSNDFDLTLRYTHLSLPLFSLCSHTSLHLLFPFSILFEFSPVLLLPLYPPHLLTGPLHPCTRRRAGTSSICSGHPTAQRYWRTQATALFSAPLPMENCPKSNVSITRVTSRSYRASRSIHYRSLFVLWRPTGVSCSVEEGEGGKERLR